jgi:hypothetical protein
MRGIKLTMVLKQKFPVEEMAPLAPIPAGAYVRAYAISQRILYSRSYRTRAAFFSSRLHQPARTLLVAIFVG